MLTQRDVWERYIPSRTPALAPDAEAVAKLTPRNPHCQLIEAVSRYRGAPLSKPAAPPLTPIRCETWYRVTGPHGIQTLPRRDASTVRISDLE